MLVRHAHLVAVALVTCLAIPDATAEPVGRIGAVGGYDASAPGHREDGLAAGAGYRYGPWTAELDYSYLQYDGSTGVGGGAHRAGVLMQHLLYAGRCSEGTCPHIDLDLGLGYRWVSWEYDRSNLGVAASPLSFRGRELEVGFSANFLLHLALHYVVFEPESATLSVSCRSTRGCSPMLPSIGHVGVLLEASFALGGS